MHACGSRELFNRKGELKNIRKLKFWPLEDVLFSKYVCLSTDPFDFEPAPQIPAKSAYLPAALHCTAAHSVMSQYV